MKSWALRFGLASVVALMLSMLPLPTLMDTFRPPWILLLILYVQFFLPTKFRIYWVMILGLCLDVLQCGVLGEHALALMLTSWIASNDARRIQFFTLAQQMVLVMLLSVLYQTILLALDGMMGYYTGFMDILGSALVVFLGWPWFRLVADEVFIVYKRMGT